MWQDHDLEAIVNWAVMEGNRSAAEGQLNSDTFPAGGRLGVPHTGHSWGGSSRGDTGTILQGTAFVFTILLYPGSSWCISVWCVNALTGSPLWMHVLQWYL